MSWQGTPNAPNWQGSQLFEETAQTLYTSPVPPSTTTNPSIGITNGNVVLLPNAYNTLYVDNLTVGEINGATGPVGAATWSTFPAISNVSANLNDSGDAQYNISGFENIFCGNLYAEGSGIFSGGAVNCQQVQSNYTTALVGLTCGNNIVGQAQFVVNGGSTLDGGAFHGTTIGSLPVNGVNTVRIDVLPVGIDMFSPTYISMNAGGAGDFVAGGAMAIAAGDYITLESSTGTYIKSPSGNLFTLLYCHQYTSDGVSTNVYNHDYGVNVVDGILVQSNKVEVRDIISVPAFQTYPLWLFATNYQVNDGVCYSFTNPTFGAGAVYQCLIQGSGVRPDTLYAPAWVSGTAYVPNQLVQYNSTFTTMIYRCINATSGTQDPEHDTSNWFPTLRSSYLPCWQVIQTDNLYDQIYFDTAQIVGNGESSGTSGPSTATYYWALCAPVGSGLDGLAVVKRNVSTNDLMAIGRLYDDTIYTPPFVPSATGNLNMNGYDIQDCGNLYTNNIFPISPATFLTWHGDMQMEGTDVSILDLNYLRLLGQTGSPSTIRWTKADTTLGLSVGLTGDTIASYIEAEDVLSLYATSFASYGDWNFEGGALTGIASIASGGILYCASTLNMSYGDITNLQILSCDTYQAYSSSHCTFNSPVIISSITSGTGALAVHSVLDMTDHDIINCPNISGGASADFTNLYVDYINPNLQAVVQIQSTLDMDNGLIQNVNQINVDYLNPNMNVIVEVYGGLDCYGALYMNGYNVVGLNAIEVDYIQPNGNSFITMEQPLDMFNGLIQNTSQINVDTIQPNLNGYVTMNANVEINGLTCYGGLDMQGNDIDNCSNLYVNELYTYNAGNVSFGNDIGMNNNQVLGVSTLGADNITSNIAGYVYINAPAVAIYGNSSVVSIESAGDCDLTSDSGNVNIVATMSGCNITASSGAITLTAPTVNVAGELDLGFNALTGVSVFTMNGVQQPTIFFGSGTFLSGGNYSISFPTPYNSTLYSVILTNSTTAGITPFVGVKSNGSVIVWGTPTATFDWVSFGFP